MLRVLPALSVVARANGEIKGRYSYDVASAAGVIGYNVARDKVLRHFIRDYVASTLETNTTR